MKFLLMDPLIFVSRQLTSEPSTRLICVLRWLSPSERLTIFIARNGPIRETDPN